MRRLVDVDELIKYFDEDLEGYDNREYILQMLDVKGRIERVDAIPIEFIERKLAEHWYVDYDIRELLDDWEKENGN